MKVRFSKEAENDLLSIGDYIAKESPLRALDFVRALRERAAQLAETPLAYPVVSRFSRLGIRRRVFRDYLILYRVDSDSVRIVRVLHGAQDIDALLGLAE